ncbi:unnamed protein product [Wuchereria bancrofti]|nr:unnamed protein product [Wuchereria bancrofti]
MPEMCDKRKSEITLKRASSSSYVYTTNVYTHKHKYLSASTFFDLSGTSATEPHGMGWSQYRRALFTGYHRTNTIFLSSVCFLRRIFG